ncbi:ubiquitin-conjugating enzyme/RWD-like protein [Pseudomassariella vexata]|uniref:Ubiquitin-conjugating enzyme E2 Z n=1 Tax=Pseudomassariella vexata TaxID=1141098 RepID=A0A1Y2DBK1_9PEZI|nr:ubiquitin-conjugating enzyme/RWD-like protein [Pseudomassariella vexata]ORY56653.1 ubiquitin-conjugating enzyme/RWD-like protein [Pseudomassariella vexata]
MATTLRTKRMTREHGELIKANPDYFVYFKDDGLTKFDAYVVGPEDTLYQHKFVKLRFEIPEKYPLVPPKVTFIQHSGQRIHPNLYVEGKVCLSIIGTWPGEPWAYGMNCHTVLITIRSLLDNQPYKHEPNQPDDPAFNRFVQFSTWRCLLLDYLRNEKEELGKAFLQKCVLENGPNMLEELHRQRMTHALKKEAFTCPYVSGKARTIRHPDYDSLIQDLTAAISTASGGGAPKAFEKRAREEDDAPQSASGRGNVADFTEQHKGKRAKKGSSGAVAGVPNGDFGRCAEKPIALDEAQVTASPKKTAKETSSSLT